MRWTHFTIHNLCIGPEGKRNVGRPIRRWADGITHVVGNHWIKSGKDGKLRKKLEEAFRPLPKQRSALQKNKSEWAGSKRHESETPELLLASHAVDREWGRTDRGR
ncbi:hypothetical protein EVAR_41213_1 [Eumeta japonica]|uniref:Uncharacterized protein n=1 Tax=Eumeta variegata TaxID=151549 RepID=A0A4C1W5U4_EUMVA|nr:hypothetical protein EVAR_41213_1 [Eumeta japonica]